MKQKNFLGWVGFGVACFLIFSSCSVLTFMPAKDNTAISTITQIQGDGDALATAIIDNEDKTFATYKSNYELVNVEIANLLLYQKTRLHGKVLVSQATQLQNIFTVWYNFHAKNVEITNPVLEDFQKQFDAACYAILIGENSLK